MARTKGRPWRVPEGFENAFVEFQTIPNIGKAMAEDLVRLRIRGIRALARRTPLGLYRAISRLDGVPHDPCVLDAFMAAVEFARTGSCRPWWEYTPQRKAKHPGITARRPDGHVARRSRPPRERSRGTRRHGR